jgi:hypothetical protein
LMYSLYFIFKRTYVPKSKRWIKNANIPQIVIESGMYHFFQFSSHDNVYSLNCLDTNINDEPLAISSSLNKIDTKCID